MARPREFDRDAALEHAMKVFWEKGFAATSTDDLVKAMGVGRQSLYNAFGDKRRLYLEALAAYQHGTIARHLRQLGEAPSPLAGIRALLSGLVTEDDDARVLGCMGLGAVGEFGTCDPEVAALRQRGSGLLQSRLVETLRAGQACGEIDPALDPLEMGGFIQLTMTGLQLAARAGATAAELHTLARFAADRLQAR